METLAGTEWDVVIVGTGLSQSLLALALSRSGKKVLHVDKNGYYGGSEAALSLQEAEDWAKETARSPGAVSDGVISNPSANSTYLGRPKLSLSRSYSIGLAPQLIYTQSRLLQYLVSSKVYRQLEFLAMGSWWVYDSTRPSEGSSNGHGSLLRVPTNREDVAFSDSSLDLRSKRTVMKVLRFVSDYENHAEFWEPYRSKPLSDFLTEHFKLPYRLSDLFLALTLTPNLPNQTTTEYALPRIARHLRSIGRLGPGFSSIIPKWGGLSEIVQVACRAGAVGGGVYVLGSGLASPLTEDSDNSNVRVNVTLKGGDVVKTSYVVGSHDDFQTINQSSSSIDAGDVASHFIMIVSSKLATLFPVTQEGSPNPAGAMVIFPSGSLGSIDVEHDNYPSVYLILHSSETGECPAGQTVVYASTSLPVPLGPRLLEKAVEVLLQTVDEPSQPAILWSLQYQKLEGSPASSISGDPLPQGIAGKVLTFPPLPLDLAFDDSVMDQVSSVWKTIMGDDVSLDEFLVFPDRDGEVEEEW